MNLDQIPTLIRFTRLYWNQMGYENHGSVENALREMVNDEGEETRRILRKELMLISGADYSEWFMQAREDRALIRQMGGSFILPEKVPHLLIALEAFASFKSS